MKSYAVRKSGAKLRDSFEGHTKLIGKETGGIAYANAAEVGRLDFRPPSGRLIRWQIRLPSSVSD